VLYAGPNAAMIPIATTSDGKKRKAPLGTYATVLRRICDEDGWVWSIHFGLGCGLEILDPSPDVLRYVHRTYAHGEGPGD
jgi:hypothetical protein